MWPRPSPNVTDWQIKLENRPCCAQHPIGNNPGSSAYLLISTQVRCAYKASATCLAAFQECICGWLQQQQGRSMLTSFSRWCRGPTGWCQIRQGQAKVKVWHVKFLGHVITPEDRWQQGPSNMPPPEYRAAEHDPPGTIHTSWCIILSPTMATAVQKMLSSRGHTSMMRNSLKIAWIDAPVLWFYDPTKQLLIQADASKDGLGACLLQEYQVSYASKALRDAEQRYALKEKELAILGVYPGVHP